jgi:hypothetical protein
MRACPICNAFVERVPVDAVDAPIVSDVPEHDCREHPGTPCGGSSKPCKKCKPGPLADDDFPK